MLSRNVLPATFPPHVASVVPYVLDSGGFTELQKHGRWRAGAEEFADDVRRVATALPGMVWAAPQDWMCEPVVIAGGTVGQVEVPLPDGSVTLTGGLHFIGTNLSVAEHQERTVENFLRLRELAPDLPFIPVLQGWEQDDYHRCADLYASAGVDLAAETTVGLGSVCRRQHMAAAVPIVRSLAERGFRLHAFGFKQQGLAACWPWLESADSMAWSWNARSEGRNLGRSCGRLFRGRPVKSCGNCRHYAVEWWGRTVDAMRPVQLPLF